MKAHASFREFILLVFFVPSQLFAQNDAVTINRGIDKFILGSPKSGYAANIGTVSGGTLIWNDTVTTTYEYCSISDNPVLISDIPFRFLMLTFNEKNEMHSFEFTNMYADKPSNTFLKKVIAGNSRKAIRDHKALVKFLNEKWKQPGRETVLDKAAYYSTHEWKTHGSLMKLTLQYSKKNSKNIVFVGVYLQALPVI